MEPASGTLIYLIKQLELGLRPVLEDAVSREGLSAAQYTALTVLRRRPGLTSSELARRSFVRAQTMAETIAFLMKRDLISREVDPTNGRRFLLYITADGDRVVEALRNPVGDVEALLLNGLEETQRQVLIETLRACRDSLGEAPRVRDRVTVGAGASS